MISLITPNYNGEKWLDDCLDSVASQTSSQDNIEMIFVDDGSTDNSRGIVESYKEAIPGLKPIWHEHIGKPGALRNVALTQAIGTYVLFLDSDDYIGQQTIERLEEFTKQDTSDVVAFQLTGLDRSVPSSMLKKTINNADIVDSGLYKTLGIWKMCRRDFLDKSAIRFDDSVGRGDDAIFFAEAMLKARRVSVVGGYPFYTVRGREDGSSITQNEWDHNKRIDVALRVGKFASSLARSDDIANHFLIRIFNSDALEIISSPNVESDTLERLRTEFKKYWSPEVARLIYTDAARDKLTKFFEGDSDGK
jgi:glycosyltransferase involved in cell wall biosynthesis